MSQGATCRGSARSIPGYSIHDALAACAAHLRTFGGHDVAAGLSLDTASLEAFTDALIDHANAGITEEQLTPVIRPDCEATLAELQGAGAVVETVATTARGEGTRLAARAARGEPCTSGAPAARRRPTSRGGRCRPKGARRAGATRSATRSSTARRTFPARCR